MEPIFKKEKSIFQKRINEIISDDADKKIILDLIELYLLKQSTKNSNMTYLSELYNLVGIETFADIIELMNGREIQFPDSGSFIECMQIVICYYYRYLKGKSWDEIKDIFQDDDISHIKMGIHDAQFNQFINDLKGRLEL